MVAGRKQLFKERNIVINVNPWQLLVGGALTSIVSGWANPGQAATLILNGQQQHMPDGIDACAYVYQMGHTQCFYDNSASNPSAGYHVINTTQSGRGSVVVQQTQTVIVQPQQTYPTTFYPATTHRVDDVYVNGVFWGTVPENSDVCRQVGGNCNYSHFNQAASPNGVHYVTTGHGQTQVRRHDQGDDVFCLGGRSGSVAGILCF